MSGCRMRIMGRTRCYHADSVLSVTRFASSAPARSFLPSVSLSAEATRRRERSVEFSSMASAPPHSHRLLKKPPLVLISSLGRELEGVVPISARRCPGRHGSRKARLPGQLYKYIIHHEILYGRAWMLFPSRVPSSMGQTISLARARLLHSGYAGRDTVGGVLEVRNSTPDSESSCPGCRVTVKLLLA